MSCLGVLQLGTVALLCCAGCTGAPPESIPVSGHVVHIDGTAAEDCHITIEVHSGSPVGETAAVVEEDGDFSWPLPRGEYTLTATCSDGTGATRVKVTNEGQANVEIRVQ